MVVQNGGEAAVENGKMLERAVRALLSSKFKKVDRSRFSEHLASGQPVFTGQYKIGKDIYGKARHADFILFHPTRQPNCLVIECKWQKARGTADEKYPFLVQSINCNEYDTIVVLDGGGYSRAAMMWLRSQVGKKKLRDVFDLSEFALFVSQDLR